MPIKHLHAEINATKHKYSINIKKSHSIITPVISHHSTCNKNVKLLKDIKTKSTTNASEYRYTIMDGVDK